MRGSSLSAWAAAFVALSGCAGPSSDPHEIESTESRSPVVPDVPLEDAPTGFLQGLAMDDEELPVPFPRLRLVELNVTAVGDEAGAFRFGKINIGDYFLHVEADGYASVQAGVRVVEDETTSITIHMERRIVPVAHVEVVPQRAYVNCRVLVFHPLGSMNANSKGVCGNDPTGADTANRTGVLPTGAGLVAVLAEAKWQASFQTSRNLRLGLHGASDQGGYDLAQPDWSVSGPSSLSLGVEGSLLAAYVAEKGHLDYASREGAMAWSMEVAPSLTGQPVDAGIGMSQPVELLFTFFYVDEPDDLMRHRQL